MHPFPLELLSIVTGDESPHLGEGRSLSPVSIEAGGAQRTGRWWLRKRKAEQRLGENQPSSR